MNSIDRMVLASGSLSQARIFSPMLIVGFIIIALLAATYLLRDEYLWTAGYGVGYAFGIVGACFMLLLLLYPLRKKSTKLSFFLSIKQWFKLHMLLGIFGPTLILLHCNFNPGSINSSVALSAMLLMVLSGLIGRFLYGKIHRNLYGSRLQLQDIYTQKKDLFAQMSQSTLDGTHRPQVDEILGLLRKYEDAAIKSTSMVGNFVRTAAISFTTRRAANYIQRKINAMDANNDSATANDHQNNPPTLLAKNDLKTMVKVYMQCIRRTAELNFYERVFSLWHMLHLPIFGLLIISTCFHIYAVHSY